MAESILRTATDPRIVQRAAEFYDEPRLQRQMDFDRDTYALAVARATGGMETGQSWPSGVGPRGARVRISAGDGIPQVARELGAEETDFRWTRWQFVRDPSSAAALIEGHAGVARASAGKPASPKRRSAAGG